MTSALFRGSKKAEMRSKSSCLARLEPQMAAFPLRCGPFGGRFNGEGET